MATIIELITTMASQIESRSWIGFNSLGRSGDGTDSLRQESCGTVDLTCRARHM